MTIKYVRLWEKYQSVSALYDTYDEAQDSSGNFVVAEVHIPEPEPYVPEPGDRFTVIGGSDKTFLAIHRPDDLINHRYDRVIVWCVDEPRNRLTWFLARNIYEKVEDRL